MNKNKNKNTLLANPSKPKLNIEYAHVNSEFIYVFLAFKVTTRVWTHYVKYHLKEGSEEIAFHRG